MKQRFEQETSDILVFHEQKDILNCIMSLQPVKKHELLWNMKNQSVLFKKKET